MINHSYIFTMKSACTEYIIRREEKERMTSINGFSYKGMSAPLGDMK